MNMIPIDFDGERFALLFLSNHLEEGVHFLTPAEMPLQLGFLVHPAGHVVDPHAHIHQHKLVDLTHEVLYVIEGRIEVQFYSMEGRLLGTQEIAAGDVVILMSGGHGVRVLEPCRILEVKQGPYLGVEAEKKYLSERQP